MWSLDKPEPMLNSSLQLSTVSTLISEEALLNVHVHTKVALPQSCVEVRPEAEVEVLAVVLSWP